MNSNVALKCTVQSLALFSERGDTQSMHFTTGNVHLGQKITQKLRPKQVVTSWFFPPWSGLAR